MKGHLGEAVKWFMLINYMSEMLDPTMSCSVLEEKMKARVLFFNSGTRNL